MTNKHQRPIASCAKTRKGAKTLISHNCSQTKNRTHKKVPSLPVLLICGYPGCRRKRGRVQYTLCLSHCHCRPQDRLLFVVAASALQCQQTTVTFCALYVSQCVHVIAKRAWNIQSQLQNGVIHVDMCYMCALAKHCLVPGDHNYMRIV